MKAPRLSYPPVDLDVKDASGSIVHRVSVSSSGSAYIRSAYGEMKKTAAVMTDKGLLITLPDDTALLVTRGQDRPDQPQGTMVINHQWLKKKTEADKESELCLVNPKPAVL